MLLHAHFRVCDAHLRGRVLLVLVLLQGLLVFALGSLAPTSAAAAAVLVVLDLGLALVDREKAAFVLLPTTAVLAALLIYHLAVRPSPPPDHVVLVQGNVLKDGLPLDGRIRMRRSDSAEDLVATPSFRFHVSRSTPLLMLYVGNGRFPIPIDPTRPSMRICPDLVRETLDCD